MRHRWLHQRWSQLKPAQEQKIFLLAERNKGEPCEYLLNDAYALGPSYARPKWQASERSVYLTEGAKRAVIVFSCGKEYLCAGRMLRMVSVENRNKNRTVEKSFQE